MQKKLNRLKAGFIAIISLYALPGCNVSGTWNNDHIDPAVGATIDQLNSQVVAALENNKPDIILPLCSDQLIARSKNELPALVQQVGIMMKGHGPLEKANQFYQKNTSEDVPTTMLTGMSGDHDYAIGFKLPAKENVATVQECTIGSRTLMLLTVYSKYGNSWKLNVLKLGISKVVHKDAIAWYKQAKVTYEAGDTIDAANELATALTILKPGDEYWRYQKEQELQDWANKVRPQINKTYTFPLNLVIGKRPVSIFNIGPQFLEDAYYPQVNYVSSIPFSDTASLSRECDSVHALIGARFPAFARNNEHIAYRAFKKVPTGANDSSYGFIRGASR